MEKFLFIAFRSREHTIKFYELLKTMRLNVEVITTPREAGAGCGLSVKFYENQKKTVKLALGRSSFGSLIGVYEVVYYNNRKYVTTIYL